MDTVVAGSALFAAFSVRDWIKDKVKNKGFEHAERLLSNLHQSHIMMFMLKENLKLFAYDACDGSFKRLNEIKLISAKAYALLEESKKLNIQLSNLLADLKTLKAWDMKCTLENEYEKYIEHSEKTRGLFDDFLYAVADESDDMARSNIRARRLREIESECIKLINEYLALNIRFEDVFIYSPQDKKAA